MFRHEILILKFSNVSFSPVRTLSFSIVPENPHGRRRSSIIAWSSLAAAPSVVEEGDHWSLAAGSFQVLSQNPVKEESLPGLRWRAEQSRSSLGTGEFGSSVIWERNCNNLPAISSSANRNRVHSTRCLCHSTAHGSSQNETIFSGSESRVLLLPGKFGSFVRL